VVSLACTCAILSSFKVTFFEPREQMVASLLTIEKGFSMNDELVEFLDKTPELGVKVNLVS
jgi:preprotein translocase subunit SecF